MRPSFPSIKFLTAHCEKINPFDGKSEQRLKIVAIENDNDVDNENDKDGQVTTTNIEA